MLGRRRAGLGHCPVSPLSPASHAVRRLVVAVRRSSFGGVSSSGRLASDRRGPERLPSAPQLGAQGITIRPGSLVGP